MPKRIRKSQPSKPRQYQGSQPFEHWYADNQVWPVVFHGLQS